MSNTVTGSGFKMVCVNWKRWVALLAMPFTVLFIDTYLNTEILKKDLRMVTLNADIAQLNEALNSYQVDEAKLATMLTIEQYAATLGLVPPTSDQIRVMNVPSEWIQEAPFAVAGLGPSAAGMTETTVGVSTGEAAAPESGTAEPSAPMPGTDQGEQAWISEPHSGPARMAGMMSRLREVIANAYTSYSGRF